MNLLRKEDIMDLSVLRTQLYFYYFGVLYVVGFNQQLFFFLIMWHSLGTERIWRWHRLNNNSRLGCVLPSVGCPSGVTLATFGAEMRRVNVKKCLNWIVKVFLPHPCGWPWRWSPVLDRVDIGRAPRVSTIAGRVIDGDAGGTASQRSGARNLGVK